MKPITLTVNDSPISALVEPRTHLADFLRHQAGLTGTHLGCEQGVCGACTVIIDGQPQRSCITYAVACEGRNIRTVEGFDADPTMLALREAFSKNHALQCGFCTPGMLITARDIVARLEEPDEGRVRNELAGNLCRCTGYMGIVAAVQSVLAGGRQPMLEACATPAHPLSRSAVMSPSVKTDSSAEAMREPVVAATIAPAKAQDVDSRDWAAIDSLFTLPHSPATVWALLADPEATVGCMPGARLTGKEGAHVHGQMDIKFGPITATIEGSAVQSVEARSRRGQLVGNGTDRASGTKIGFETVYQVTSVESAPTSYTSLPAQQSNVELQLRYRLAGPLAQFAREGLIKAFAERYLESFSQNIDAKLKGESVESSPVPSGVAMLAHVVLTRLRSIFRKSFRKNR